MLDVSPSLSAASPATVNVSTRVSPAGKGWIERGRARCNLEYTTFNEFIKLLSELKKAERAATTWNQQKRKRGKSSFRTRVSQGRTAYLLSTINLQSNQRDFSVGRTRRMARQSTACTDWRQPTLLMNRPPEAGMQPARPPSIPSLSGRRGPNAAFE
jgi:hypothetical protein